MSKKIKTIFFDIGGVLLNINPDNTIRDLSQAANLTPEEITQFFPEEALFQYEKGFYSDEEYFLAVKSALPPENTLAESDFWDAWLGLVEDEKETVDLFFDLQKNYSTWLLSNTNHFHVSHLSKTFSFYNRAHGKILSFELGTRKPEPNIYQQALEKAKVEPAEAVFIDDLEENIIQAQSMGINSILFLSPEDLKIKLREKGVRID